MEDQTIMNEKNDKLVRIYYLIEFGLPPHEVLRGQLIDRSGRGGHPARRPQPGPLLLRPQLQETQVGSHRILEGNRVHQGD